MNSWKSFGSGFVTYGAFLFAVAQRGAGEVTVSSTFQCSLCASEISASYSPQAYRLGLVNGPAGCVALDAFGATSYQYSSTRSALTPRCCIWAIALGRVLALSSVVEPSK